MSWLAAIPAVRWIEIAVAFTIVAFAAVIYTAQQEQIAGLKVQLSAEKAGRADDRTAAATALAQAAVDASDESDRRVAAQARNDDEALAKERAAHADAVTAVVASGKLLDAAKARARALASRQAPADSAAGGGSAAAAAPDMVLPDVLGRVDGRAGELAEALDVAHIRGQQCERDYDALSQTLAWRTD